MFRFPLQICLSSLALFFMLGPEAACVRAEEELWKLSFSSAAEGDSSYDSNTCFSRLSPDGKLFAIACNDRSVRIWDLEQGTEIRRLIGHVDKAMSISFSRDSKRIVTSPTNGYSRSPLRVWSVATGELLYEHQVRTERIGGVEYHPSGDYFAAAIQTLHPDGSFQSQSNWIFDAKTFRPLRSLGALAGARNQLVFSPDGTQLLVNHVNEYWPATFIDMKSLRQTPLPSKLASCAMSPDGRYIVGCDPTPAVVIVDAATRNEVRRFPMPLNRDGRPLNSRFNNAVFGANSRTIFVARSGHWSETNIETGKVLRDGQLSSGYATVTIAPDGLQMIEASSNGPAVVWNLQTGRPIAKIHLLDGMDRWAIETSDGYYDHSDDVTPFLPNSIPRDERETYVAEFRSSTMVTRLLRGMSVEDARSLPENGAPPSLALTLVSTEQESATVQVIARTATPEAGIRDVSVRVDGRELRTTLTKALTVQAVESSPNVPSERRFQTEVRFPPGRNSAQVQAVAIDTYGQQSKPATVTIERPVKVMPVTGRLFVLAVGVSEYSNPEFNLKYSHADAEALAEALLHQKGRTFGDVQVQVYTNKLATVTNVKEGLAWLQRSCTPADVAIVLFSGHGITKEKGLYYVTHEANMNGVQFTCLNWETIAGTLKNTQAKQILFLADACYAGAFGETDLAPQQELAESLRRTAGVMVFTSSRGDEVSFERPEWGHGAFCKAIIEGLTGRADLNADGRITVSELQKSVTNRVAELTDDKQHPDLPQLGDYDPNLVIAEPVP